MVVFSGTPAVWTDVVPAKFDIVYSYFPFHENPSAPAINPHFTVVLDRGVNQATGALGVLVAYGTSRNVGEVGSCEVVYAMEECKFLKWDTKFDLRRRLWLPYNRQWFVEASGRRTPKIGAIPEEFRDRLLRAQENTEKLQGVPIKKVLKPE